jgi:hypothetical protein
LPGIQPATSELALFTNAQRVDPQALAQAFQGRFAQKQGQTTPHRHCRAIQRQDALRFQPGLGGIFNHAGMFGRKVALGKKPKR